MSYFTIQQLHLLPSFDLEVKEREKIYRFLQFLDDSCVGEVIQQTIQNGKGKGGRPNCNYHRLFATILYGFAFGKDTLRDIEDACRSIFAIFI